MVANLIIVTGPKAYFSKSVSPFLYGNTFFMNLRSRERRLEFAKLSTSCVCSFDKNFISFVIDYNTQESCWFMKSRKSALFTFWSNEWK